MTTGIVMCGLGIMLLIPHLKKEVRAIFRYPR